MKTKQLIVWLMTATLVLTAFGSAFAAFGDDIEKPKPVFTEADKGWVAELIPRGKSSNIQIRFQVEGGTLAQPAPKEFTEADGPKNIDWKNYRSGYFLLDIIPDVPGGEVKFSLSSDFFTSATDIWGWIDKKARTWGTIGITTQSVKGEPTVITAMIKDGSVLDEDGAADGKIQIIIGPRDHFWGFAIGTLIIRFFGVFLVLTVLMLGMMLSGKVFEKIKIEKREGPAVKSEAPAVKSDEKGPSPVEPEPVAIEELPQDIAAAVGLGIHLYTNAGKNLRLTDTNIKAAAIGLALHLEKNPGQ